MTEQPKKEKLFGEFPPVSTHKWEEQIKADLKGADYDKKLIWNTPEGFKVAPYYRREHLEDKKYLETLPGMPPYNRGTKIFSNDWEIRQDIKLEDIDIANQKSLFILERGISSLGFRMGRLSDNCILKTQDDFSRLLNGIYIDCIYLNFVCGNNSPVIVGYLQKEVENKNIDPEKIHGSVDFDPLGYLSISGNFGQSEETDFYQLNQLLSFTIDHLPNYRILGINGYFFNNAGATVVQELAFSFAMAVEYLSRLTSDGHNIDKICHHLQFNFGVGSNYFMEIAKIRAARYLWSKIVESYHPEKEESKKAYIQSFTSDWNKTIYDPYVNILRTTTESMAAVLGGTDSLTVRPFDFSYKETSKFSGRLARNIQIILKEESYFNKIVDPGAGSYYIENLTDSIIEETWKLFLNIDSDGGYLESLKKGNIQKELGLTVSKRKERLSTRKEVLLGTNQYPNIQEEVKDSIVEEIAFPTEKLSNTLIEPIKQSRGATEFEKLRLAVEKHKGKKPVVFLLTYGNPLMRKARAGFSSGFFACAGYEIIDNNGFDTIEDGVKEALERKADIVVICSSDDEYADIAPKVYKLIDRKAIVAVAGAPACMEELKAIGITNFIHIKSNILNELKNYNKLLGI
ncbi:MAG: methylmalonyl-CoA mutase small subunit [Bacteroidales bacterium]|nr:methylmalonyl-CoA mutase small subunit [Bacteroidales bacterium]